MPELEQEELDPQLMVLRDAIDMKLAAGGIFNSEMDGLLSNHPLEGPRIGLVIRIGMPYPSLAKMAEVREEIMDLFTGGRVDLVLDESIMANESTNPGISIEH